MGNSTNQLPEQDCSENIETAVNEVDVSESDEKLYATAAIRKPYSSLQILGEGNGQLTFRNQIQLGTQYNGWVLESFVRHETDDYMTIPSDEQTWMYNERIMDTMIQHSEVQDEEPLDKMLKKQLKNASKLIKLPCVIEQIKAQMKAAHQVSINQAIKPIQNADDELLDAFLETSEDQFQDFEIDITKSTCLDFQEHQSEQESIQDEDYCLDGQSINLNSFGRKRKWTESSPVMFEASAMQ